MDLFYLPDLKCGACLGFVVRSLQDVGQAIRVEANLAGRKIGSSPATLSPPSCGR